MKKKINFIIEQIFIKRIFYIFPRCPADTAGATLIKRKVELLDTKAKLKKGFVKNRIQIQLRIRSKIEQKFNSFHICFTFKAD